MKLILVVELLLLVAFLVLLERKILGLLQLRKGPNIVRFFGILQTICDRVKLIIKEILYTKNKRIAFFFRAPFLALVISIMIWQFIPRVLGNANGGGSVLLVLLLSSLTVFSIIGASWGSNNVYALVRRVRATAQMCSYEVVIFLFIRVFVFPIRFIDWEGLILSQNYYYLWLFGPVFFIMWVVVILAELNRTPFDLVERESELVGGYNVEYASFGFTLFFLAEYMSIWFMSAVTVLMFIRFGSGLFMTSFLVFLMVALVVLLRRLLPRFKFYDLIFLTWRVFLPLVLLILVFWALFLVY